MTDEFLAFAKTKPPSEIFDYWDNENCAFARFFKATGRQRHPVVQGDHYIDDHGEVPTASKCSG